MAKGTRRRPGESSNYRSTGLINERLGATLTCIWSPLPLFFRSSRGHFRRTGGLQRTCSRVLTWSSVASLACGGLSGCQAAEWWTLRLFELPLRPRREGADGRATPSCSYRRGRIRLAGMRAEKTPGFTGHTMHHGVAL